MEIVKNGRTTTFYCNRPALGVEVQKPVKVVDEIKRDEDPAWKKKEVKYGRQ
jgi:hypothetical protein